MTAIFRHTGSALLTGKIPPCHGIFQTGRSLSIANLLRTSYHSKSPTDVRINMGLPEARFFPFFMPDGK